MSLESKQLFHTRKDVYISLAIDVRGYILLKLNFNAVTITTQIKKQFPYVAKTFCATSETLFFMSILKTFWDIKCVVLWV